MVKQCAACDSTETYVTKEGYEHWTNHDGYTFCHSCSKIYIWNPITNPTAHKKWDSILNPRRIRFGNKRVFLKENPRKGKCKKCGETKRLTHMHHMKYDKIDPLKYTKELCINCHSKETMRLKKIG